MSVYKNDNEKEKSYLKKDKATILSNIAEYLI